MAGVDADRLTLTSAQVEPGTAAAAVASVPNSARTADFDSNFDDDFGFDNQTFSHTNAHQAPGHSKEGGSSEFDDNFDSAFDIPATAAPAAATTTTQAPPLPARATAVGFDDDFFSTPSQDQPQASQPQSQTPSFVSAVPVRSGSQPYDAPPAGSPPAQTQHTTPANPGYAPPAGPPPQQTTQAPAVPALPSRTESDGDMPQVKELVGMGFNRRQAIAALEDNQFDLERAANALLSVNN